MIFYKFFGRLFYIKILIIGRLNITQNTNRFDEVGSATDYINKYSSQNTYKTDRISQKQNGKKLKVLWSEESSCQTNIINTKNYIIVKLENKILCLLWKKNFPKLFHQKKVFIRFPTWDLLVIIFTTGNKCDSNSQVLQGDKIIYKKEIGKSSRHLALQLSLDHLNTKYYRPLAYKLN